MPFQETVKKVHRSGELSSTVEKDIGNVSRQNCIGPYSHGYKMCF